jgi:hypothetical protein
LRHVSIQIHPVNTERLSAGRNVCAYVDLERGSAGASTPERVILEAEKLEILRELLGSR